MNLKINARYPKVNLSREWEYAKISLNDVQRIYGVYLSLRLDTKEPLALESIYESMFGYGVDMNSTVIRG